MTTYALELLKNLQNYDCSPYKMYACFFRLGGGVSLKEPLSSEKTPIDERTTVSLYPLTPKLMLLTN